MAILKKIFGDENTKAFKKASTVLPKINALESDLQQLSDKQLIAKTNEFKSRLSNGETLDDLLPEAFAVAREAGKRTLGMRAFDVQIIGGAVIHNGDIAEMRTGEGKTLVATLPIYLNALEGKGVHLVTVNDYLAKLHAALMGQLYAALGLTVGVIAGEDSYLYRPVEQDGEIDKERDEHGTYKIEDELLSKCTRKEAYDADITYGTNSEFGFDYLRDNVAHNKADLRQRGFNFAIVDEIDSILIDEARTPLIISAPAAESGEFYMTFANIAKTLIRDEDYTVDEKLKAVQIKDSGIEKAEKALGVDNIYTDKGIKYVHHLETAVRAQAIFTKDKDYVVHNGEIVIVDEFTGRMQPGRRWSEGLHQAIEAKEGVEVQKESRTYASVTYQNYFRMYDKLAGMTGTATTSSEEFYKVYGLNTVEIPTNVPPQRIDEDDLIYQTQQGKFKAIARKVKEVHQTGQPILIGTASVETNELLSAYLDKEGVKHEVLNAKNHEREGEIIARAGQIGAVTIATNMAGRGVDIKLGGPDATTEQIEEVKRLGGLFVLGTERHEARRIDNQLRGRSGRQGDPGHTQFFVSLEDSLMRVFASDLIKNMMGKFGIPEDEPIQQKMISRALESAQTKIEGFNFDSRKQVLAYDDILNKQRQVVYKMRRSILLGDDADLDAELDRLSRLSDMPDTLPRLAEMKKQELGDDVYYDTLRAILLQTIDMLWVDHLELMDYTRQSVNLRAYGQRDPLIEYKKEGLRLFRDMEMAYVSQVTNLLESAQPTNQSANDATKDIEDVHKKAQAILSTNSGLNHQSTDSNSPTTKFGRNDKIKITNGVETKELKFKKAESLLSSGEWRIV
jgi:preprotein translocase subunit SecA